MNWGLPDVQAGFRKGRGTRDQIANICWIIENSRELKKKSTSASLTMKNLWMCEVAQLCPTLCDPWTVAHQAPPSMGFSRQEYWSGLPFECVDHKKLWNIFSELGKPYPIICLLRNLYAGQEAVVKTGHRTMDWFKIGKGVHRGCITVLIICRVHHVKCRAGWSTSWSQTCWEK